MKRRVLEIRTTECKIMERVNRFVVKVKINKIFKAHVNNTGRLSGYFKGKAFCVKNKSGTTDYRLISVEENGFGAIVDTQLQMKAFETALKRGFIPWLDGYRILKRNVELKNSLIDYLLECGKDRAYLEVKSALLRKGRCAMYPDCPSVRGRRHVKDITEAVKNGETGFILFIAALPNRACFKVNAKADKKIQELLIEARKTGVQIKSIGMYYNPKDSFIYLYNPDLKVRLR